MCGEQSRYLEKRSAEMTNPDARFDLIILGRASSERWYEGKWKNIL